MSGKTEEERSLAEKLEELHSKIAELKAAKRVRDASGEVLLRTRRALVTLSECSRVLVRATREHLLLGEVCRVIVEEGGYRMAWVGYAERDEAKTVSPVAYVGFEEGYLEKLNVTWADTERGRGPTGTAIRTGQPYVIKDIVNDSSYTPWRKQALKRGFASSIALPLIAEGQTLGALNIYAAQPNAFDRQEIGLLVELANDLAYGITALRVRRERDQAEERLRTYLENAPDGVYIISAKDGTILYVNRWTNPSPSAPRTTTPGTTCSTPRERRSTRGRSGSRCWTTASAASRSCPASRGAARWWRRCAA